jgi:hypothetical protein
MQITISIGRTIVVNDDIDSLDINTATEDVCCNEDALFECLEGSVAVDAVYMSV